MKAERKNVIVYDLVDMTYNEVQWVSDSILYALTNSTTMTKEMRNSLEKLRAEMTYVL